MVTTRIEQPGNAYETTGTCGFTVTGNDNEEGGLDVSIYIIGEPQQIRTLIGYLLLQAEETEGEDFVASCLSAYAKFGNKPVIPDENGIERVYIRSAKARAREANRLLESVEGLEDL